VITSVNAQKNVIKADPVGLIFGIANASYENAIKDNQSLTFSGLYYHYPDNGDRIDLKGFGLGATYNFYFSKDKDAPRGFHAGPGLGYSFLNYSKKLIADEFGIEELKYSTFNLSANAGYQWILGEHFAIDLTAQYYYFLGETISGIDKSNFTLGVGLGYAW